MIFSIEVHTVIHTISHFQGSNLYAHSPMLIVTCITMAIETEYEIRHYVDWIKGQQKKKPNVIKSENHSQQVISCLSWMEEDSQPQTWVKCVMGTTVQLAPNQEQKGMDQDTDQHIVYI